MIKAIDTKFPQLSKLTTTKEQTIHDVEMFRKVCDNIKIDLKSLNVCIKELRRCLTEAKSFYEKFITSHDFVKNISYEISIKLIALKTLVTEVQSPNVQVMDLESRAN